MRQQQFIGAAVLAVAVLTVACVDVKREATTPTSPTSTSASTNTQVSNVLTTGAWSSASTLNASSFSPGSCGNFQWAITSMTTTSAAGTFKAVCGGGLTLQGSAEGTLSGFTANITANGTASTPTIPSCTFTLAAVAVPESTTSVKVTYNGNVCGIAVAGTEVLKKP
jgi:hypothetical protein